MRYIAILVLFFLSFNLYGEVLRGDKLVEKTQKELSKVTINTKELVSLLKKEPNTKIIDIRTKADIVADGGFIKANKVVNIPRDKLEFIIADEVDENEKFVVHCLNGHRSALASKRLKDMGYKKLLYYKGSYEAWQKEKLPTSSLDKDINSFLYSKVKKVAHNIYTSIGRTSPSTYENSGHNNNLGFIIGKKYVFVWNAGANYLLAKAFHEEIKKITNLPVRYVLLENSQGHAMLGSSYWKEQGAKIVAHKIAKDEIKVKMADKRYLEKRKARVKDKLSFTKIVLPDIVFEDKKLFDLGGIKVEANYFGYAHEHSDIVLWIPKHKVVFAGDIAFNQRLLPIFEITQVPKWLQAWQKFAKLDAKIVVPGHGDVTNMKRVTKYTKDYLVYLQSNIQKIIDDGGDQTDAYKIDMHAYEHLDTYKELGLQNIGILFRQMEFQ